MVEYHAYNTNKGTEENKGDNLTVIIPPKREELILSPYLSQPPVQLFHWLMLSLRILYRDLGKSL